MAEEKPKLCVDGEELSVADVERIPREQNVINFVHMLEPPPCTCVHLDVDVYVMMADFLVGNQQKEGTAC